MKFLGLIFFVVIFINLNLLKNEKIKNLCTIAIVFSLLVGCVSSSNESMIDKVSSEESNISSISEISSEDKFLENSKIVYENSETTSGYNNSGDQKVYIPRGNSYYHKSASCKFIQGADLSCVSISDVGGKHPCNCIKY